MQNDLKWWGKVIIFFIDYPVIAYPEGNPNFTTAMNEVRKTFATICYFGIELILKFQPFIYAL